MSQDGSTSKKKEANGVETHILAQAAATSDNQIKSFDNLDGFEQLIALILMAFSLNNADNDTALETVGDALSDDGYSTYIRTAKENNQTPKEAARDYTGYTSEAMQEVGAIPAQFFTPPTNRTLYLPPNLVERMNSDPRVAEYVDYTLSAAEARGLDGSLVVNQLWQESRFDPKATSYKVDDRGYFIRDNYGEKIPLARGIGQFIEGTGKSYGLNDEAALYDPFRSIDAAVSHMGDLTNQFGDQGLALVAYNGGERAVTHLHNKFGQDISLGEWVTHMEGQRSKHGTDNPNKWRVQSFNYIHKIDPRFWSDEDKAESRKAMASLEVPSHSKTFNAVSHGIQHQSPTPSIKPEPAPTDEFVV